MSGQYNSRNSLRCKAQHASDITFGDVFQRAGYATGIFGKWKRTHGTKESDGKDYIFEFGWDAFCCFDVVGETSRIINPRMKVGAAVTLHCQIIPVQATRQNFVWESTHEMAYRTQPE